MGDRPLVQSLTTLVCEGSRRPAYFRGELMATLKIADRGDIPLDKLNGSWAGAFGQTQFMPSTFLRLAVDLDGSGRDIVDIRRRRARLDRQLPAQIRLEPGRALGLRSQAARGLFRAVGPQGQAADVRLGRARDHARSTARPLGDGEAGLLLPAGADGPAFLVTHNFDVIYSYNAAESYTLAIAILAQRLAGGHGIVTPWPTDDPGLSRAERRELQTLLAKHGYDVGAPDGAIGAQDQIGDRGFRGQERVEGRRPRVGEGAGGAAEVGKGPPLANHAADEAGLISSRIFSPSYRPRQRAHRTLKVSQNRALLPK